MESGIYQIRNRINGKRYIGSAVNLVRRWGQHLRSLRRREHRNPHLQHAFAKYGEDAFAFSVLEDVKDERLLEREQHYLDSLRPEYNICPTAGSRLGCHHTSEARAKISMAKMGDGNPQFGKHLSEATRTKISQALTGRELSEETRRNISEAHRGERGFWYGKHFTEQHRRKQSEAQTGTRNSNYGKRHTEQAKRKMREARKLWWRQRREK